MAQARNAIRESLDTDADVAAADAMIEALLRTAEGTAVISWRHSGTGPTRALRVEVVDQSQMPSVRDLPDQDTGPVEPTDSGRVTELLDTSRQWGFRLDTVNGSRTRWFEIATSTGQPDPSQATPEPVFRLPLPRGQIEHNVQRARNEVAELLRRATQLDEGTIASAVLAVSEFAGNAATYADENGAEISVSFGEGRVQIGVTDGSRGLPTSRPEGHVDRSDQVEASSTVDKAERNRILAQFDIAALESGGFGLSAADSAPSEPGRPVQPEPTEPVPSETEEPAPFSMRDRAVGEHGRGFAIVMAEAVAYGVDLAPNGQAGKKVWVEYRLPPTPPGAHPDEAAAAAVGSLLANAGDLDPDLTLVFHPASTSEGLSTPEHVATVAAAVGDMMRERGWQDPSQIEAATELVRHAGLNAIAYMERYADLMRQADVRQSELDTALRDMTASLTLRMCTNANSRSLHVSVEVNQHRPERDPRIVTLTWPAPLFSHDQIGAAVRAPLGSATESAVEQWGEVWARFDEPSSDESDIAVTEPPPHTDLYAKARIARKLYVDHHIRVLGWENPDVPVWAVNSVDRALRDRMAELGGRFALRHVRFGEINAEYGLTESFGTTTSDAKDHYSCITLSTGMFTDPEVARRWEQRQSTHFLARSPEDMVYQTTHHEFLHVVAGDSDWMLHDEAPAMLRAAYQLYAAEGLLPGVGFDEWLALLPDYVFVNANPRTQTFDPPEGARAGAVESSLPLTDPARILHWLTVTRDGSSPAQTFARWAKMQAAGDPDGRELSLLLQDFADVTGRADIVTTAHPRDGRTTGDVLEAVTGGQLQPFTSTSDIHAQLRNWSTSLDSEGDGIGHGISALVVEPPSPGQPDGRAYLLVQRVIDEESVRIELRNPGTGVLLANHVPTIGSPELPGALAMFFDPAGAPVRPETVGAGQTSRREARGAMPIGAAEIAAALGIDERQAQDLANPAVKLPPGGLPLGVITRFGPGDAGDRNDPGPNQPPHHTEAPLTPPTTAADAPPVGSREWLAAQLRQAANGVQERAWNTLVEQTANLPFGVEEVLSGEYRRYLDDPDKLAEFTAATSGLGFTERLSLVAVLEQAAAKHRAAGLPISFSSGSHTANAIPVIADPENLDPVAAGLLIADVIEAQLLGKQAIWASGKLHADFHEFDRWALTSAQGSQPPGLSPKIVMNCIKLPLYASALGHVIDHSYLQSYIRFESWNNATVAAADGPDFTWLDGTEIYEEEIEQHSRLCRLALAPHRTYEYRADDPNTPLPNRGDLVYVYELSHVAVATGELGPDGSPALFTFWPYTSWPRAETVRISTVNAELAALTDAEMQSTDRADQVKVTFGPGPWGRGGTKYQPELEEWLRRHPGATPAEPETPTIETGSRGAPPALDSPAPQNRDDAVEGKDNEPGGGPRNQLPPGAELFHHTDPNPVDPHFPQIPHGVGANKRRNLNQHLLEFHHHDDGGDQRLWDKPGPHDKTDPNTHNSPTSAPSGESSPRNEERASTNTEPATDETNSAQTETPDNRQTSPTHTAPAAQTRASSPWSAPQASATHTESTAPANDMPPSHGAQQGERPATRPTEPEDNRRSGPTLTPWKQSGPGQGPGAPPQSAMAGPEVTAAFEVALDAAAHGHTGKLEGLRAAIRQINNDPAPNQPPRAPTDKAAAPNQPTMAAGRVLPPQFRQVLEQHLAEGDTEQAVELIREEFGDKVFQAAAQLGGPRAAQAIADEVCAIAIARFRQIGNRSVAEWVDIVAQNLLAEHRPIAEYCRRIRDFAIRGVGMLPSDPALQAWDHATTSEVRSTISALTADRQRQLRRLLPIQGGRGAVQPSGPDLESRALRDAVRELVIAVATDSAVAPSPHPTAARLARFLAPSANAPTPPQKVLPKPRILSDDEMEVLRLVAAGKTNRQIAETRRVSDGSVRYTLEKIRVKLGVGGGRADIVKTARQRKILDTDDPAVDQSGHHTHGEPAQQHVIKGIEPAADLPPAEQAKSSSDPVDIAPAPQTGESTPWSAQRSRPTP